MRWFIICMRAMFISVFLSFINKCDLHSTVGTLIGFRIAFKVHCIYKIHRWKKCSITDYSRCYFRDINRICRSGTMHIRRRVARSRAFDYVSLCPDTVATSYILKVNEIISNGEKCLKLSSNWQIYETVLTTATTS